MITYHDLTYVVFGFIDEVNVHVTAKFFFSFLVIKLTLEYILKKRNGDTYQSE